MVLPNECFQNTNGNIMMLCSQGTLSLDFQLAVFDLAWFRGSSQWHSHFATNVGLPTLPSKFEIH